MESTRNCLLFACFFSVAVLVRCDDAATPTTADPGAPTPAGPTPASGAPTPAAGAPTSAGGAPTPAGQLPPITTGANVKDVLGDLEKGKVCAQTVTTFCAAAGPADDGCKAIATAVGGTTDPCCSAAKVCQFTVTKPVQTNKPGLAYITTRDNLADNAVIFPCNNNQLVIVVPKKELGGQ